MKRDYKKTFVFFSFLESTMNHGFLVFCCLSIIMEDFIRWGQVWWQGAEEQRIIITRTTSRLVTLLQPGFSHSNTQHVVSDRPGSRSARVYRTWKWKLSVVVVTYDVSGSLLLHLVLQEVCHRHDPVHVPDNYN